MENSLLASTSRELAPVILGTTCFIEFAEEFQRLLSKEGCLVVFVTRRCSCLGYLFLSQVCEKWEDSRTQFLTDSALVESGYTIGRRLAEGEVKEVLLVDDSISYGRAVRSVLLGFLDRVTEGFLSAGGNLLAPAYLTPLQYVQSRVKVFVFRRKVEQLLVLPSFYQQDVICKQQCSVSAWNEFSDRLSELLNVTDVANTAFVISAKTNGEPAGEVVGWIHVETSFREAKEDIWLKLIPGRERPSAICAVRRLRNGVDGPRYRYIPFIFLPALSDEMLTGTVNSILERISRLQIPVPSTLCVNPENAGEFNITARKRMEFLTMYLSHSLLLAFAEDAGMDLEHALFDHDKIAWNFTSSQDVNFQVRDFLGHLCEQKNRACMLSWEELCKCVEVFPCGLKGMDAAGLRPVQRDDAIEALTRKSLEDYLYGLGVEAEALAHNCIAQLSSPGEEALDHLNHMRYDSFFAFIGKLQKSMGTSDGTAYLLAMVFQLMDNSAMSVVVSNTEDGAEQQIRVCEQALFLWPRRYIRYMGVLKELDYYASTPMDTKCKRIGRFVDYLKANGYQEEDGLREELRSFLRAMKYSSQAISDWDIRLERHFVIWSDGLAHWDFEKEKQCQREQEQYSELWRKSKA